MQSIEHNIAILSEMISVFKEFILSDGLFWPLPSKSFIGHQRMSLGSMLLVIDQLSSLEPEMNDSERKRVLELRHRYNDYLKEWRTAIERKAKREMRMRLNLWQAYLEDIEENSELLQDYPNEVRNRVMMERLAELNPEGILTASEEIKVRSLERKQELLTSTREFIWDEQLTEIYPFDDFPYLYR
jgi:hypothetical protein